MRRDKMTDKELMYVEDALEQSKQLEDISNYYMDDVSDEVEGILNDVADTSKKQFKRIFSLL
jgi:hypothetical protein